MNEVRYLIERERDYNNSSIVIEFLLFKPSAALKKKNKIMYFTVWKLPLSQRDSAG